MRYVLGIEIAKNEFNFLGLFSRNSPAKYFDDTHENPRWIIGSVVAHVRYQYLMSLHPDYSQVGVIHITSDIDWIF